MMTDLVENRLVYLSTEFALIQAQCEVWFVEDHDAIGCDTEVVVAALRERNPFIDAQEPSAGRVLLGRRSRLDNDDHVLHLIGDPAGQCIEGIPHFGLKGSDIHRISVPPRRCRAGRDDNAPDLISAAHMRCTIDGAFRSSGCRTCSMTGYTPQGS